MFGLARWVFCASDLFQWMGIDMLVWTLKAEDKPGVMKLVTLITSFFLIVWLNNPQGSKTLERKQSSYRTFSLHYQGVILYFPSELHKGCLVKPKNINKNYQVSRYCADLPLPALMRAVHCSCAPSALHTLSQGINVFTPVPVSLNWLFFTVCIFFVFSSFGFPQLSFNREDIFLSSTVAQR